MLDFIAEKRAELKAMEHQSFGKFWQTVRAGPRLDLEFDCGDLAERLDHLRTLRAAAVGGRSLSQASATDLGGREGARSQANWLLLLKARQPLMAPAPQAGSLCYHPSAGVAQASCLCLGLSATETK